MADQIAKHSASTSCEAAHKQTHFKAVFNNNNELCSILSHQNLIQSMAIKTAEQQHRADQKMQTSENSQQEASADDQNQVPELGLEVAIKYDKL